MFAESINRNRAMHQAAEQLFEQAWLMGRVKFLLARLFNQSRELLYLGDLNIEPVAVTHLERQPVNLDKIIGTSGRLDRFDCDFLPVRRGSRARWIGVATAMMDDIYQMPVIEIVQVGEHYYVIDGNHRVSAARAMNKLFIDANVTRWEFTDDETTG